MTTSSIPSRLKAKNGPGSELAVRIIHKPTGKPVEGVVLFRTRLDMSPDSMGEMTAKHVAQPSTEPGVYKFRADLTMAGGVGLQADGQGAGREPDGARHCRLQGQIEGTVMKTIMWVGLAVAAVLASAVAGYRAGSGAWPLPVAVWEHAPPKQVTSGTSPQRMILYWQDPDGSLYFSPGAKKTADGRDYVPVYEDQEADFKEAKPPAPAEKAGKRILYYRNPMGLPDTSPVPKKDWMGMDYIPVYDGEQDGGNTVSLFRQAAAYGRQDPAGGQATDQGNHQGSRRRRLR